MQTPFWFYLAPQVQCASVRVNHAQRLKLWVGR